MYFFPFIYLNLHFIVILYLIWILFHSSQGRVKRQGRVRRQMKQPAASHLTVTRCNSLCGTKPQSEKHRIAENSVITSLPNIGPSLHLWEGSPRYNYLASRFASRLYSSRFWWQQIYWVEGLSRERQILRFNTRTGLEKALQADVSILDTQPIALK